MRARKYTIPTKRMAQKEKRLKMPLSLKKKCSRGDLSRTSDRKSTSNIIGTEKFKKYVKPEIKLIITPSKQIATMESKLREYRNEKSKLEDRITELESSNGFKSMQNNKLLNVVREHHLSVRPGLLRQIR